MGLGSRLAQWRSKRKWSEETDDELDYWRQWLEHKGGDYPWDYTQRFDPNTPLQPEFVAVLPAGQAAVSILDCGAGPMTYLGKVTPGVDITITAIDALADRYATLFAEYGVTAPVVTRQGETEQLRDLFPAERFDIVCARNTLDHSYAPFDAISAMCAVAKPGGAVYLKHIQNEGEKQKYHGLHQWNLAVTPDGRYEVWNLKQRIDVCEALADVTLERATVLANDWHEVVLRKNG